MKTIVNYNNTLCDLKSAKIRLQMLIDKKTALWSKYFPMNKPLQPEKIQGGHQDNDPMASYMIELTKIDKKTGKSLDQEIEELMEEIKELENYLSLMEECLNNLSGLEAELYREIVCNNLRISKAVEKVADNNDRDVSTIWRMYHKKVKEHINQLKVVG